MAIFEDGVYAVKNGDMYKITLPEPVFKGAKTIKLQLRPETNAERIRSMRDGELAVFLGNTQAFCCIDHDPSEEFIAEFKTWLKEEYAE